MILFDANVLISLSTGKENDDIFERISGLIQDLVAAKTIIGVPAPAWAEFLCGTGLATSDVIQVLKKRSAIRILPFDEVAATELAFIDQTTRAKGSKKGASKSHWQKIKVDRQILATARVLNVTAIYTEDDDLIVEATRLGVTVHRTSEIPLKPKQNKLDFDSQPSENEAASARASASLSG
ncbi:type II toxin-antitoxin system VapC family toxin [Ralstonia pseudosolanacearum]|uniref:type II toxin-antitoxin system VapC family toxin n=1 Tax=Ralstonia pseudosolanacearum TaxID=1310165 RepID=UPI0009BE0858|nr:PIN domain-containing protein [Ralstonia pseudosolanacearum]MCL1618318.1 PIN domain-containing protein [Ralstonia pseudosolanacearum CaRs-Mep]